MTINEMIAKFRITLVDGVNLSVNGKLTSKEIEDLKASKADIVAELTSRKEAKEKERREAAERLATNVPGLEELRHVRDEWEAYQYRFNKFIEGDCIGHAPIKPTVQISTVNETYPIAAAYLKAESFENASNYAKSSAGKKAKERIADGEDYTTVLADMEAEWTEYTMANIWN